jgi:tape measure domain-containing protein
MADIQKTVSIIFQGEDRVSAQLGKIEAGLDGVGTEAGEASGKVDALGREIDEVGGSTGVIDDLRNAFALLAASVVVKQFIDANVAAEKFEATMRIVAGSTEAAAEEWEYIKRVANDLGIRVDAAAVAYAGFAAATKGTAQEGQAAREIFEAVAGTIAKLGGDTNDVAGALVQLSQGVSKGRFELQDLKSIAERIPGFFNLFADALGVTTAELFDLISTGKITGAEIEILAAKLNKEFGDIEVKGFVAEIARLNNAWDDLLVTFNKETGIFGLLTDGVSLVTAGLIKSSDAIEKLVDGFTILSLFVRGEWRAAWEMQQGLAEKYAAKIKDAKDETNNLTDSQKKAGESGEVAGSKIADGMKDAEAAAKLFDKQTGEVDKALKVLGIDPKQFKDPIQEAVKAFEDLAKNPAVTGEQFLSGLLVTLDKIKSGPEGVEDIKRVLAGLTAAYSNGTVTAEQYEAAIRAINVKQTGLWEGMIRTTEEGNKNAKALDDQAKAAAKAEEETRKYALELEKLASNERIALIEARVALNIAGLEADTKRVEAAFESINEGIKSTGELLGSLFGNLTESGYWSSEGREIRRQIDKENERRDQEFELQEKLVEAQIARLKEQTRRMQNGDALLKIEGDGLKPHLEAFMWEILRSIQVRVNADGLDLLVGA